MPLLFSKLIYAERREEFESQIDIFSPVAGLVGLTLYIYKYCIFIYMRGALLGILIAPWPHMMDESAASVFRLYCQRKIARGRVLRLSSVCWLTAC